jgi:hypothetical protein
MQYMERYAYDTEDLDALAEQYPESFASSTQRPSRGRTDDEGI